MDNALSVSMKSAKLNAKIWVSRLSLTGIALLLLIGCTATTHSGPNRKERDTVAAMARPLPQTLRLATFNIENLGVTKVGREDVLRILVDTVHKYDIVAIQELSDSSGEAAKAFRHALQIGGHDYELLVSRRSGLQADDKSSQEQYAFAFNRKTVAALESPTLYDDEADDFQREPFVGHFRSTRGNFTFVVITIHTAPKLAVSEIDALHKVNLWAKKRYSSEDDFITVGDLNASGTYASTKALDKMSIRGPEYFWIVPDSADTNLSASKRAYDRIIVSKRTTAEFTGEWDVDRSFNDRRVSDHWPVWAEFFTNLDSN